MSEGVPSVGVNLALRRPIRKIAVFRALVLGDLLCAVPALRALRRGFQGAEITLVGLPWAAALSDRLDCVDRFIEFPGHPGLPEVPCDVRRLPDFFARMQAERFDLALQLHGSGPVVNPLVALFGARQTAGFFNEHAWRPEEDADLYAPWPETGHEIERLLALTDRLGLPRDGPQLDFPLRDSDRDELHHVWPDAVDGGPYVCIHAGAQLPSRRWPAERFAAVADRLIERGRRVVLTGAAGEASIARAVAAAMRHAPVDLVGRTSLWTLGALIERAERLVCNDTGVSHIAAALRVPSVVVSSGADVARWAPLDHELHRVLWQDVPCRPCSHHVCPYEHACATAIEPSQVLQALGLSPAAVPTHFSIARTA